MHPTSWPNGEYQQAQQHFQPSQPSLQLTQTSAGSYQGGTVSNATLSGPVIRGLNTQEAAFMSKYETWHQAYISRQITKGHLVNNGAAFSQVAPQPHGHPQNLQDMKTNTAYCHQNIPAQVNQMVSPYGKQLQWMQNGNPMSNNDQHNMVQRSLHQNVNRVSTEPFLVHKEGVTSTSPSASVQTRLINPSLNDSQGLQQSASTSYNPQIGHNIHQSPINGVVTTNSSPNPPNYTAISRYINRGVVTSSPINMNLNNQSPPQVGSFSIPQPHYNLPQPSKNEPVVQNTLPSKQNCQNSSRSYFSGTQVAASSSGTNPNRNQCQNSLLAKLIAGTGQYIPRQQRINSGENISHEAPYQTLYRSANTNLKFVPKGMESNPTMHPVAYSAAESCNSKSSTLPQFSNQPSAKNTGSIQTLEHSTDKPPQQSFASQDLSITPTTGGSGNTLNKDSVELKHQLSSEKEREFLEQLEMFIHLYSNDNSIHSSGQGVPKAVAVVPPLSQNNMDTASDCSQYTEAHKPLPEGLKEASPYLRDNCKTPPETANTPSKPSITPVTSSELPQSQHTSQKTDRTSDRPPEPSVNMQMKQRLVQASPSEVLRTQNGAVDNSGTPAEPKLCAYDLSSVPTVQWTILQLRDYINLLMRTETTKPASGSFNKLKILQMFWGGSLENLARFYPGTYKSIADSMTEFFGNVTNTIRLTEVKDDFKKELFEKYRVLKHDEIYEGVPYVSSWLNINEKLDDIDKEFGFPWSLKACRFSDSEAQQDCAGDDANADISNEASDSSSSRMDFEPANSHQEEFSADENSNQCMSPTESSVDDSDPLYSFKIEVLPPEEAKMIFEENKIQFKEDTLPQKANESSTQGDLPSIVNSSLKTTDISQIPQICCITKWMENMSESSDFTSKCKCTAGKDCTDGDLTSAKQAQAEESSEKNMASSLTHIDNAFNDDFIGAGDTPQVCEPEDTSYDSKDDSRNSSVIFVSENKDQQHVPKQMDNPVEESELAPIELPGRSLTSDEIEKKTEIVTTNSTYTQFDSNCIKSELKSSDMPDPPMEGDTQPHARSPVASRVRSSKSKKETGIAELILFGSTSQGRRSAGRQTPSSAMLPEGALRPPEMLSVDIRPLKPTTNDALRTGNVSVKRRLYEKWWRSLTPSTLRHWNKANVVKKLPGQHASLMKAKRFGPTSNKHQSVKLDGQDKEFQDQKKKDFRSLKKRRKNLTKPTECRSRAVVDPQEDKVLDFSVLPKTFSFKDGSNKKSNIMGSVTGKTLHTEADVRSGKQLKRKREAWYPKPDRLYCPLRQTSVQTTSGVFHEFQKRYIEKKQTPTDA